MSTRILYTLGLIIVVAVLSASVYFQIVDGIMPCPLCTLQRITFGILGIWFLIGILFNPQHGGRSTINWLALITSSIGLFLAGRQVYLQHFPPADSSACGVSLQYMIQVLPINEVIQKTFAGTAECTARGWELLSLNMAEWAVLSFSGFVLLSIYLILIKKNR